MKIGVIGSGVVGQALATAFLREEYPVMLGTRDIKKEEVVKWKTANKNGQTGSFKETASFGELIILATKGSATLNAIELAGKENFTNKVIIDTTNPLADSPPVNGMMSFFTGAGESMMEKIIGVIPGAKVVKAFSSVGSGLMYKPDFNGLQPTMFICGNDTTAKEKVTGILKQFGWEAEDMGAAEAARVIEPLAILWCIPGFLRNDWTHAFKLLKK
jgi:8-hydroxy-5-deazaflavin:NADPH oxidoreductase